MTTRALKMEGPWHKGNLHLHTNRSDGRLALASVAEKYAAAGYDFIAITDHWKSYCTNGEQQPLMILNGVELDGHDTLGCYFHVLALGLARPLPENGLLLDAMAEARDQGALLIWAHPHWTGNQAAEALPHDFDGLEIYNHSSQCEIGKGYATSHWDTVLENRPDFLGIAVDDAHFQPRSGFWDGGWVSVCAPECSRAAILDALRRRHFYASQGPRIDRLVVKDNWLGIDTTPIRCARLVGPRHRGKWIHHAHDFRRAEFQMPTDWSFVRLEIEDACGKQAWTNPLGSMKTD
ncbi:MAG: DUF3604 domain-containing protein [Desulfobacterales bacterium]|nr:DUF3604 domain-containing protein [Desulfobacterales bacterium]